tara:strand:+ start:3707 stop:4015 length:309 start_codon:yes stop_codon:yes gene_type:complete
MAKSKEKKSRQGKLKSLAKSGFQSPTGNVHGKYMKYGDLNPADVHEGPATYRGATSIDDSSTSRTDFSTRVKRGHSKSYFRFQGKLYQITNTSGTASTEVKV